jgi:hypothetical protein
MNNHQRDDTGVALGTVVDCPTCGLPAEITDQFTLSGAPEPIEHVKLVCLGRHWYTLPLDMLPVNAAVSENPSTSGITRQR